MARRPELGKVAVGDTLIMRSGPARDRQSEVPVRVVTVGRKYLHVVLAEHYEQYTATPPGIRAWRWSARQFLIEDQHEGARGTRFGQSASVATAEQHAFDEAAARVYAYLREQRIQIQPGSPWQGREAELAEALKRVVDA